MLNMVFFNMAVGTNISESGETRSSYYHKRQMPLTRYALTPPTFLCLLRRSFDENRVLGYDDVYILASGAF